MSAYNHLIDKIDEFIRSFYKSKMVRGIILFALIFIVSYVLVSLLEYFGRFNSTVRAVLLFTFIIGNGYVLLRYIVQPLLKLNAFGKRINRYQASEIIGDFFPEIKDSLLNTLQLSDQIENSDSNAIELLEASVNQKSKKLQGFTFVKAIDKNEQRRYFKYLIPLLGFFVLGFFLFPSLFRESSNRVMKFNEHFEIKAPFDFHFAHSQEKISEGEDFSFQLNLMGNDIPQKVFMYSPKGKTLLEKIGRNQFAGTIEQVRSDFKLYFEAGEFTSKKYAIDVLSKMGIVLSEAMLEFPKYIGRSNEEIENTTDLVVPEGTKVKLKVRGKNVQSLTLFLDSTKIHSKQTLVSGEKRFISSGTWSLQLKHNESDEKERLDYSVEVIKDAFPEIIVNEIKDSLIESARYFTGSISDDYGLKSLRFVYQIENKEGKKRKESIPVRKVGGTEQEFEFAVDFRKEKVSIEDKITYYFVVSDNDGVNGSKSTTSQRWTYLLPSLEEVNEQREEERKEAKSNIEQVISQTIEFQKDINNLRNNLNNKSNPFQNQQELERLKMEQENLLNNLEEIKEEINESIEDKNQLSELDKELLKQQEEIQKLMEELMDDELKSLLDELSELMKQNNELKIEEKMEELEMSSEEMKKQLDQSLEMLKRLEVNEKIDEIEEELEKLSKDQEKLKEEVGEKGAKEEHQKEQEKLNERFEDIQKDLEKLDSLNQVLDRPMDLEQDENLENQTEEEMQNASENLEKNKSKKAQESQQKASDLMQQMMDDLSAMQQRANQQQQSEDIEQLRNILESLVKLSLNQEELISDFKHLREENPIFKEKSKQQQKIINDTKSVRDSLMALAVRQPSIGKFVKDELKDIAKNQELSMNAINEFQNRSNQIRLGSYQQYTMTGYNNLALLLNESLEQMQQQMNQMMQKEGSGSCSKPGGKGKPGAGKKPSSGDMKQMLKQQLESMKKGKNPGKGKEGENGKGSGGKNGAGQLGLTGKQIAKMAAEQNAMKRRLEEMRNKLNGEGKGKGNGLNPLINLMEDQEKDLLNKNLSNNLIQRQKEIMTRLLESEKALMERELSNERKSKEGKNQEKGNLNPIEEYNKQKLKQIELLRSVDPLYFKYYQDRANEYFNRL